MAQVSSTVSPGDVQAMKDILERIFGTPIAPTGDIEVAIGDKRYAIKKQDGGGYHAAVVD